ncbi:MAG: ADP-ribosylglycohydrolase family protein [Ruminococcaceae bacterium]|nr:ADP-ribosylglycohydrolase family protein [Oscillospiraceae bacterium]
MLGAVFGDVVGSVYEFHNIKTKEFPLFGEGCFFTDDTVMTVAVAEALLDYTPGEPRERLQARLVRLMREYGRRYPDAGYGGRFSEWLRRPEMGAYHSLGNGSAMRVAPVAYVATSPEEATALATATAEVTHDHPEGIKGAVATAGTVYLAANGASKAEILAFLRRYYPMTRTVDEIRPTYAFNETCEATVPEAMQAFLESTSFEDAIRTGISLGGDSDTLCAICGSVAEAYYGMTEGEQQQALSYLDAPLTQVTERFLEKYPRCGRRP